MRGFPRQFPAVRRVERWQTHLERGTVPRSGSGGAGSGNLERFLDLAPDYSKQSLAIQYCVMVLSQ